MSLLEWSPTTNSIVTVSIHYYERDEYKVQKAHDGEESQLLIGRSFCRKSSWAIPTQLISTLIHNNDAQYSTFMVTNLLFFLFVNRISWTHPTKITIKSKSFDFISFITNNGQCRKWPYSSSFVIDLESIDKRIKNVIDMTFLGDYYEPTLAILFETEPTWTG